MSLFGSYWGFLMSPTVVVFVFICSIGYNSTTFMTLNATQFGV